MGPLDKFFVKKRAGGEFSKAFYDLGLQEKLIILGFMEIFGLLASDTVKFRAANALLQHYRGEDYPVTGINRLSKAAREADEKYGI